LWNGTLVGQECPTHTICGGFQVSGDDFADDLMSGNDSRIARREFSFNDMKVGPADATCEDAEENMARFGLGRGDLFNSEW
jgi:hypothetical protein